MAHVSHVSDYAHPMGTQHSCALHLSLVTPPTPPTSGISGPTPKTTPLQKKPGNPCKTWKAVGTRTRISIRSLSESRSARCCRRATPRRWGGTGPRRWSWPARPRREGGRRGGSGGGRVMSGVLWWLWEPQHGGVLFWVSPTKKGVFRERKKRHTHTHTQMQGCLFGPGREMESTNWGSRIRKV